MGKTIGLKQLAQKVYQVVQGLPPEIQSSLGEIEDAWDAIIYGASGNGKTNCTIMILKALLVAMVKAKAEYVSYEEGHAKTVQDTMIGRHNMLEIVGNRLAITEHLTFEELDAKMGKKQSAKIWVIDSLQASQLTYSQCKALKQKYVLSRKKKIIIYVAWSEGKLPQGACGKAVEYYANIKMRVEGLIMFPKSRYGGNKPYVIHEPGAKAYWQKQYPKKAQIVTVVKSNSKQNSISHEIPVSTNSSELVASVSE